MILLDDDLPKPLLIGQVGFKNYLPSKKSKCPGIQAGTFFEKRDSEKTKSLKQKSAMNVPNGRFYLFFILGESEAAVR